MAYLAEFAVAAAVAAAALVPSAALVKSAASNAAETKCYTVAHGLTKAMYEYRNNRILLESGRSAIGNDGSVYPPLSTSGMSFGGQYATGLHEILFQDCTVVVGDLGYADVGGGVASSYGNLPADPKCVLLPSFNVLIEFLPFGNDQATVRYSSVRPKPGNNNSLTLAKTNGAWNDFVVLKTVMQGWRRTPDGRPVFSRPMLVVPDLNSFEL